MKSAITHWYQIGFWKVNNRTQSLGYLLITFQYNDFKLSAFCDKCCVLPFKAYFKMCVYTCWCPFGDFWKYLLFRRFVTPYLFQCVYSFDFDKGLLLETTTWRSLIRKWLAKKWHRWPWSKTCIRVSFTRQYCVIFFKRRCSILNNVKYKVDFKWNILGTEQIFMSAKWDNFKV